MTTPIRWPGGGESGQILGRRLGAASGSTGVLRSCAGWRLWSVADLGKAAVSDIGNLTLNESKSPNSVIALVLS